MFGSIKPEFFLQGETKVVPCSELKPGDWLIEEGLEHCIVGKVELFQSASLGENPGEQLILTLYNRDNALPVYRTMPKVLRVIVHPIAENTVYKPAHKLEIGERLFYCDRLLPPVRSIVFYGKTTQLRFKGTENPLSIWPGDRMGYVRTRSKATKPELDDSPFPKCPRVDLLGQALYEVEVEEDKDPKIPWALLPRAVHRTYQQKVRILWRRYSALWSTSTLDPRQGPQVPTSSDWVDQLKEGDWVVSRRYPNEGVFTVRMAGGNKPDGEIFDVGLNLLRTEYKLAPPPVGHGG